MSILTYNFISECLKNSHEVTIILPDKKPEVTPADFYRSGKKYPVLWLLHGTSCDHSDWVRRTNIETYATARDLAVVMPSAMNSDYSNWKHYMAGYHMYDYLTEELMPLIYGWFPISDKREDNFIAGLSMGGRGAIKYAVNYPEKFDAAAILSAVPINFQDLKSGHECPLMDLENPRMKNVIANAGGLNAYINSEENVCRDDSLQQEGERHSPGPEHQG